MLLIRGSCIVWLDCCNCVENFWLCGLLDVDMGGIMLGLLVVCWLVGVWVVVIGYWCLVYWLECWWKIVLDVYLVLVEVWCWLLLKCDVVIFFDFVVLLVLLFEVCLVML